MRGCWPRAGGRIARSCFLLLACGIIFVSQWPVISREAALDAGGRTATGAAGDHVLRLADDLAACCSTGIGSLTHLVARALGGKGHVLFRAAGAVLGASGLNYPAWLFYGLVTGFIGPGPAQTLVGAGLLLAFLSIWGICLREAEISPEAEATA
jgi:hypothetical protein